MSEIFTFVLSGIMGGVISVILLEGTGRIISHFHDKKYNKWAMEMEAKCETAGFPLKWKKDANE